MGLKDERAQRHTLAVHAASARRPSSDDSRRGVMHGTGGTHVKTREAPRRYNGTCTCVQAGRYAGHLKRASVVLLAVPLARSARLA